MARGQTLYRSEVDGKQVVLIFHNGIYELTLKTKDQVIAIALHDPTHSNPITQARRT